MEAAEIIRALPSPLIEYEAAAVVALPCCLATLSVKSVAQLNPLRMFIPSSSQKPEKTALSGDLFWFLVEAAGTVFIL